MDISQNQAKILEKVQHFLNTEKLDALWVPTSDRYLSEYNALDNNLRYALSGFAGSTGDGLFLANRVHSSVPAKPFHLFVDGRYHTQADRECFGTVFVHKLSLTDSVFEHLKKIITENKVNRLGVPAARVSLQFWNRLQEIQGLQCVVVDDEKLLAMTGLPGWKAHMKIQTLDKSVLGQSFAERITAVRQSLGKCCGGQSYLGVFIASDDVSYILSARAYAMPYLSSMLGQIFISSEKILLFLSSGTSLQTVPSEWNGVVEVIDDLNVLQERIRALNVQAVLFNSGTMNAFWPNLLSKMLPAAKQESTYRDLIDLRARKTKEELASIRSGFLKSSRAIARTLRHGISMSVGGQYSEQDQAEKIAGEFKAEGALGQSFNTISGFGENSAVIHYGKNSPEVRLKPGQFALLDCGAYYAEGFATDTTRGFVARDKEPEAWQKEIYTACLKAGILPFIKPLPKSLNGKEVDALIRGKVKSAGYDYMHGTGHGIGIHVHEDGVRLSTLSNYPQVNQAVVSVEPGIYLEGRGGVRVENVAILHEEGDFVRYENIVFVGYDWSLVDVSKLDADEKEYLKNYEAECRRLGTEITDCPL